MAALSFEAVDADVAGWTRGHQPAAAGQVAVAARDAHAARRPPSPRRAACTTRVVRCRPQVDGAALDALARWTACSGSSSTPPPRPAGRRRAPPVALASGDLHAVALALTLDGLRGALAQAATLVAARASARSTSARADCAAGSPDPRGELGRDGNEYTGHGAPPEVRMHAAPAAARRVAGAGMESHASFAALSVRETHAALDAYADALATELVLAARALRPGRRPGKRARTLRAAGLSNQPMTADLQRANLLEAEHPWPSAPLRAATPNGRLHGH